MHSYHQLYIHATWTTWRRQPLIVPEIEAHIHRRISEKCRELDCEPIAIGGIEDHVHLLIRFTPRITIARLVGEVKGASSYYVTHHLHAEGFFKWQTGYGAISVSPQALQNVQRYISNQRAHHRTGTLMSTLEFSSHT